MTGRKGTTLITYVLGIPCGDECTAGQLRGDGAGWHRGRPDRREWCGQKPPATSGGGRGVTECGSGEGIGRREVPRPQRPAESDGSAGGAGRSDLFAGG